MAMVMSPANITKPLVQGIKVLPAKGEEGGEKIVNYCLHDVRFRLDSVGNEGLGDAADYMNIISAARDESFNANVKINTEHRTDGVPSFVDKLLSGGPEAGCILGPVAAPIAGLAMMIGSIFDL
ncbi:MAG: hypothetical protein Q9225_004559 [Loekoesia sp. 1 TL-2023]